MKKLNKNTETKQCTMPSVGSSLFNLTDAEKYTYLFTKVYENIKESVNGRLLINTNYCRKACELLGGDYDELSKLGKGLLKEDLISERLCVEKGIDKYLTY